MKQKEPLTVRALFVLLAMLLGGLLFSAITSDAFREGVVSVVATITGSTRVASDYVDNSGFSAGSDTVGVVAAVFDDTSPGVVGEDSLAALRMSALRELYAVIRDAAGNERGANVTASNELNVLESNSTNIEAYALITKTDLDSLVLVFTDVYSAINSVLDIAVSNHEAQNSYPNTVLFDAVVLDDDPTSAVSGMINCHSFSSKTLYCDIDSTESPTNVILWLEFSPDGSNWYGANSSTEGVRMIDSNGNSVTLFTFTDDAEEVLEVPAWTNYMRANLTATGTDADSLYTCTVVLGSHGR